MTQRRMALWGALFLTLALTGAAGALEIDLEYDAPESRAAGGPPVAVTFENARPADEGGDEISRICTVRSLAGIPWELHTADEHVNTVVPRYIADALRASGYDARVGPDPALPTVHVRLDAMWCAGHVHYETYINATLQVLPPGAVAPSWEDELVAQEGVTLNWGFKEMAGGFEKMFDQGFGTLAAMFASEGFRAAISGAPAPAATVAAPPAVVPAPAAAGPMPSNEAAADLVGLYYVYQGGTAEGAQLAVGVNAALELFRQGHTEESLRKAVVRVHQEIPGARTAAFEIIVPPYARAHAAELGAGAPRSVVETPPPVVETPPPAVETPPPVVETPPATDPVVTADPEMPDVLPDPEMPDVLPDPDSPNMPTPVEDDLVSDPDRTEYKTVEDATDYGRSDPAVDKTATVRGPRKPVPRAARAALGIGGAALIGGGMLGGVLVAVSCSNASGYDQHGGIPALGLVPLAGPAIVYGYWTSYGTYRYVQPYEGAAALMTALEITGAALIVVAAALPKPPPTTTVRRSPLRDVVVAPSLAPGSGGFQIHGRF